MKKLLLLILFFPAVVIAQQLPLDSIMAMKPADGLFYALEHYEIYEPHIVYAQAVLETGHFKSSLCVKHGNLFGIYDSRAKQYKHYAHWIESVLDYKNSVQSKYKGGDYYDFLRDLPYASDDEYITKIKRISEKYIQYE